MKRAFKASVALGVIFSTSAFGVSLNFSGNFRTEGALYNKGNLTSTGQASSKAFLQSRALLQPKLVIDDHFSLNSQWSLLQSPDLTPSTKANNSALSQGQGGYIFGDPATTALVLSRAWLEWISDFGVVRVGRMPVSWGYGLLWDSGSGTWDDFQTTLDRLEYRLHFGHVVGALAYSKPMKTSVLGNNADQDFYTIYLKYDNPEQDVEAGILFERQIRANTTAMTTALRTTANPMHIALPTGSTEPRPALAVNAPHPLSNNVLDIYVKKTIDYFTIGGEVGWMTGTAVDFNNSGSPDELNALGVMLNVSYDYHKVKAFLDFLYASGDATLSDRLNGFILLHRNRRPGLILGRELLGAAYGNNVGHGSPLYYGTSGFSGVYYFRPGFRVDWSPSWASGLEVIIANKAVTGAGENGHLGVELDVGTDHAFYKNFDLGLQLGYLFPGKGIATAAPGVFAVRTTASIRF